MSHCVFCAIVAGKAESSLVYEDEHTTAFMDIPAFTPPAICWWYRRRTPRASPIWIPRTGRACSVWATDRRRTAGKYGGCGGVNFFSLTEW